LFIRSLVLLDEHANISEGIRDGLNGAITALAREDFSVARSRLEETISRLRMEGTTSDVTARLMSLTLTLMAIERMGEAIAEANELLERAKKEHSPTGGRGLARTVSKELLKVSQRWKVGSIGK
jgi:hypothetical protein